MLADLDWVAWVDPPLLAVDEEFVLVTTGA
jgi:hypothetical protein